MIIGVAALFQLPELLLLIALHIIVTNLIQRRYVKPHTPLLFVRAASWFGILAFSFLLSTLWIKLGGKGIIHDLFVFSYFR